MHTNTVRLGFAFVLGFLSISHGQSAPLVFSSPVAPPGAPPPFVGAEYRYVNVIPGVDAVLSVDGLFNSATFMDTDQTGIFAGGLLAPKDDLVISLRGWGEDPVNNMPSYGAFTLNFYAAGTTTAVTFATLDLSVYDIDSEPGLAGNANFSNTLWLPDIVPATLRAPTSLEIVQGVGSFAGFNEISLISNADGGPPEDPVDPDNTTNTPEEQAPYTVDFGYTNVSSISFYWGISGPLNIGNDDNGRDRSLYLDGAGILVPVPATVWLFASALGLLGWIRRKAHTT
ncbi:MAG: hypothetical protein QNJ73_08750 [Gammaproteobacteria bacterium]|nr:hypothetical protein [Gammaproteobacteria bacterium]